MDVGYNVCRRITMLTFTWTGYNNRYFHEGTKELKDSRFNAFNGGHSSRVGSAYIHRYKRISSTVAGPRSFLFAIKERRGVD